MATGILRLDWITDIRDEEHAGLSWRARAVAFALTAWADGDGVCWPSAPTIARALGISKRTVQRALSELCAAGLLTWRWEKRGTASGMRWMRVFRLQRKPGGTDPYAEVTEGPGGVTASPAPGATQTPKLVREPVRELQDAPTHLSDAESSIERAPCESGTAGSVVAGAKGTTDVEDAISTLSKPARKGRTRKVSEPSIREAAAAAGLTPADLDRLVEAYFGECVLDDLLPSDLGPLRGALTDPQELRDALGTWGRKAA